MNDNTFITVMFALSPLFFIPAGVIATLLIRRVSFIGRSSGFMRFRRWFSAVLFAVIGIMAIVLWIVGI